ncbi:DUF362 domain-containing protein [Candidatus Woesearchaeota archaeon]|nr:DUF362 domain-containing protein [Candidatus Woesearchaeota archaeon]
MVTKVSIVKCSSYEKELVYKAVKQAIDLIGGLKIGKSSKVLIKPNVLSPHKPEEAITTHPAVIDAVCKILKEKEINDITIGDSSGVAAAGVTKEAFKISGIEEVAKKNNAKVIYFEKPTAVKIKNPNGQVLKEVYLAKPIFDVDLVVNVPKLKTHVLTKYTGAVKNLFGCVPGGRKQFYHIVGMSEEKFSHLLLDIYQNIKPQLSIIDGIVGLEGNGPGSSGKPKKTGLILASKDAVALDIVASKIIGFSPMDIYTNRYAIKRKLFTDYNNVEVIGEKNISIRYEQPSTIIRKVPDFIAAIVRRIIIPRPYCNTKKCTKCATCFKVCPVKAIEMLPYPVFNRSKCILCYCCIENCPENAIILKKPITEKFIKFSRKILRF